jgi:ferric-dicitrate binding protein FerR (iron transport regulator)
MNTELFIKYFQLTATPEEETKLLAWIDESEENKKLFADLKNTWVISSLSETKPNIEILHRKFNRLLKKIDDQSESLYTDNEEDNENNKYRIIRKIMQYAALIVGTICITTLFTYLIWNKSPQIAYNQLEVPCGQQAKLTLADGTRIWLNSKSKLIYPDHFSGKSREVLLDGEGYFEVTHNAKNPFIVKTSTLNVKVLGTSFNVSSYADDNNMRLTLVKGSVSILNPSDDQEIKKLKPNEMAVYSKKDNLISVKEVETDLYSSWHKGQFKFRKLSLDEISKRLGRNYNVTIFIQNHKLSKTTFTGRFYNYEPLDQILKVLKTNTSFNYKIQKDTVIIK